MKTSIRTRDYASLMVVDKALGARDKTVVFESRLMKDLHRAFLATEHSKFLFSETSVVRALRMDLSKVTPESLSNIYLKTGKECGIVMLPSHKRLNFQYAILPTHILINVYKGSFADAQKAVSEDELNVRFSNTYVGEVIITDSNVNCSVFSVVNVMIDALNTKQDDRLLAAWKDPLYGPQMRYAMKEMETFSVSDGKMIEIRAEDIDPRKHPFLYNESRRMKAANDDLLTALKCFVFLKCAKVIDKTFIADDVPMTTYRRLRKESNVDYIYVDGHWDENIKVINPFEVSGHFRNQPKKNEKGEWYKELIYIDSYMKQGYNRKASKIRLENKEL